MKISFLLLQFFIFFKVFALDPWIGSQRMLVLPLQYPDKETQVSKEQIEDVFFGQNSMSLRQYFRENSQGRFSISGKVLDWKNSNKKWGRRSGCGIRSIARNALRSFKGQYKISDYDSDKNGKIDNLVIIHNSRIRAERVDPGCMFTVHSSADFVTVMQSQGVGPIGSEIAIGFYLHEGGHLYGNLPDLYGSHYRGKYGVGMWGIMGLGAWGGSNQTRRSDFSRYPTHFEPKSKIKMGWAVPKKISKTTYNLVLRPVENSGDIVLISRGNYGRHYLEYRTNQGFSKNHPGQGLLLWRDYKIIQADGRDDINNGNVVGKRPLPPINENFGDDSDPFPGSLNITRYAKRGLGFRLENIRENDGNIFLDVVFTNNFVDQMFPSIQSERKYPHF